LLDPAAAALRVAVASNSGENLDGHFGSCPRFPIYQVGREGTVLVDVRSTALADQADDRNAARAALVDDCQVLYVQSIGGPAAAKVVRAGVHPVRFAQSGPARQALRQLQAVLEASPPWLARAMGVAAPSLARLEAAQPAWSSRTGSTSPRSSASPSSTASRC
jgi:nitrogen fixation protein NifX